MGPTMGQEIAQKGEYVGGVGGGELLLIKKFKAQGSKRRVIVGENFYDGCEFMLGSMERKRERQ